MDRVADNVCTFSGLARGSGKGLQELLEGLHKTTPERAYSLLYSSNKNGVEKKRKNA